jgi:hypothetical protein
MQVVSINMLRYVPSSSAPSRNTSIQEVYIVPPNGIYTSRLDPDGIYLLEEKSSKFEML